MTPQEPRLPLLARDDLDGERLELYDLIVGARGRSGGDVGFLYGPFNAWVYNPKVGRNLLALGGSLREDTIVDRALNELAILVTTAYWQANFPFAGHADMARQFGISDEVIDAIAAGERPDFDDEQQEIVHDVASSLTRTSTLDDELYERARAALGNQQLVEIVVICGWYTLTAFVTTTFDVASPPNREPTFGEGGRT